MCALVGILIDNALKYAPEGTTISLCLEKQGKQIKLSVENVSAVALPEENLNRLFERFYRTDPSRNSQTGGHGIGLSIASAIVSAHNGQIHATHPSPGSLRITVTLPRRQKQIPKRYGLTKLPLRFVINPTSYATNRGNPFGAPRFVDRRKRADTVPGSQGSFLPRCLCMDP